MKKLEKIRWSIAGLIMAACIASFGIDIIFDREVINLAIFPWAIGIWGLIGIILIFIEQRK